MAIPDVIRRLLPREACGETIAQIHAQMMACQEALHCATLVLGRVEATGDLADFGPALRVVERSAAQLDRLVDRLDEWSVAHHGELQAGA